MTAMVFQLLGGIGLLPAWLWGLAQAQRHAGLEPGAPSLAAFHTAFSTLDIAAGVSGLGE